jgi:hypothetical protein
MGRKKEVFVEKKRFETEFYDSNMPEYNLSYFTSDVRQKPAAFNGGVMVKKYRLLVEKIEEPVEVYLERCKKLYKESDNHHDIDAIDGYVKRLVGKTMRTIIEEEAEKNDGSKEG